MGARRRLVNRDALQRRTLRVLVAAQVLGGLGQSGAAAGALLALEITGREALSSLPLALLVVGSAAAVLPVSALSGRVGRRAGLTAALAVAAAGAAGVVVAGALENVALLLAAHLLFGAGNTAVMLARYSAADLSAPGRRGRAIATVVVATAVGAVAGPNLLAPAGAAATALGLPSLTGLYLFAAIAFLASALVLFVLLRPDPLIVARELERAGAGHDRGRASPRAPLRQVLTAPAAAAGLAVMAVANFVMVAVMVMAPVHLHDHGHGLGVVGLVISLHIAGMFAPAPLTGWLTDRAGPLPVAAAGTVLLMGAGTLAGAAGGGVIALAAGLTVLGLGWNACLIAGSTLLVWAVPLSDRPRAEGAGELGMGITAASATAMAGPVVGLAGYAALGVAGTVAAAALAPVLLAVARRRPPAAATPAARYLG